MIITSIRYRTPYKMPYGCINQIGTDVYMNIHRIAKAL